MLLSGHGVHYGLQDRAQPALRLGAWQQTAPANLPRDLASLAESGVAVYAITEDLEERGLHPGELKQGVQGIRRDALVSLYESVDQVWQW